MGDVRDTLALRNPHPRDSDIAFDPVEHKYTIAGDTRAFTSVTGVVHDYFEPFAAEACARAMVRRKDFRKQSRYEKYIALADSFADDENGLVSAICASWDANGKEQSALGTQLHDAIELAINTASARSIANPGELLDTKQGCEYDYAARFLDEMQQKGFIPYRTEWRIFDLSACVAGSIDAIFYHPATNTWHMVDWKRSRAINRFAFGKKVGRKPADRIPDCNYGHYTLQLNAYAYILRKNYGLEVDTMRIAVFHPDAVEKAAQVFILPDKREVIEAMFNERAAAAAADFLVGATDDDILEAADPPPAKRIRLV